MAAVSAAAASAQPPLPLRVAARSTPLMSMPPHRRALVLLQEMAGLTSRLSELAGSKAWQGGHIKGPAPTFLPGSTIPPEGAAATTTKEVLALIEFHQTLLFEAIGEITELQEIEQEKQLTAESITAKDAVMRDFAKRLRDAEQVLECTIEDYQDYRRPKRATEGNRGSIGLGTIDVKELVSYAHRISYTTFAPPEFASGQVPLRGALPPAPQEEQMRASQLYHVSDIDIGLPKLSATALSPVPLPDSVLEAGKAKLESPLVSSGLRALPGVPLPPSMPPGWRPGMPVELPVDLPPMPPGWKPGDSISLPLGLEIPPLPPGWKPGDAIVLPPSVAAVRPQEVIPAKTTAPVSTQVVAAPPPGVIQVPFVQLDLNPELEEDYGSDYSDEDGSTEEDDD